MAMKQTRSRSGQGALEYLMTYGWAILIIVIIGGALYSLGIFNPMTWLAGSKRATGFSNIEVRDWALKSDGLTIVLGNRAGKALVVTAINAVRIDGGGGAVSCTASYSQALADNDLVTLHPGTNGCASGLRTGNGYSLETEITFTLAGSIHTETGTITGKLE